MNIKNLVFVIAMLCSFSLQAQYISSITEPDKTKPVIRDMNLIEVMTAEKINAKTMRNHLTVLASDSLEGRETGKPGIDKAKTYIMDQLTTFGMGVLPMTYLSTQKVELTYSSWDDAEIYVNKTRFKHLWDFLAFANMNTSMFNVDDKEVVFLGYGIDDAKYSDYKKADIDGKIIMINRGEPVDENGKSFITGTTTMSTWSDDNIEKKLKLAKERGVYLVLIIENDLKKLLDQNRTKVMGYSPEVGRIDDTKFTTANHIYISTTIAKAIIGDKESKIIKARKGFAKGKPSNVILKTDLIGTNLTKKVSIVEGNNIIATIEGKSDTKKDEHVIVSAHYDHLGKRGDDVFNGADDNGSGTTALISLARASLQSFMMNQRADRSITFVWFCGEEKGLLGSLYYSKNPAFPLEKTVVDINIDMIGRQDDKHKDNPDYIYVIGSDRLSSDLHKINEEMNQKYTQLTLDYTYNDEKDPNQFYFRSDHYNFAKNGVPSIFFFSGVHDDYHKKTDDVEKINFDKMVKITKLVYYNIWNIANRPEKLVVDGVIK